MKRWILLFTLLLASVFFTNTTHASMTSIKIEKEATARFYLHNGQQVKYITLPKGQTYQAALEDNHWLLTVGNAHVHINKNQAKPVSEKIKVAKNTNKLQLLTHKAVPVYESHTKKSKQIATLAKNTRISSNGIKGNYYEVVVGGKLGYIPHKSVEIDAGVPVLIYHHFVENINESVFRANISVVDIQSFEQQMSHLKKQGYTTISLKDLDKWMQKKQALPAKAVALTFDDANLSVEKMAYPILVEKDLYGTTFVIGNRVKDEVPKFNAESEIVQFAGFNELYRMKDRIEIEHHTYSLHVFNQALRRSQLQMTSNKDLRRDFELINEVFAQIDPRIEARYYSYPFGKFNKNHEAVLIENNISLAFLNKGGKAKISSPRLYVPRTPVQSTVTLEKFKELVKN